MNTLLAQSPPPGRKPLASADPPTQLALAQPSSATGPAPVLARVGDSWTYELADNGKRRGDTVTMTVTAVDGERIQEKVTRADSRGFGTTRTFQAGFSPDASFQETELPGKYFLVEFSPYIAAAGPPVSGRNLNDVEAELTLKDAGPKKTRMILSVRTIGQERVRVPAGEFAAVRVEARNKRGTDVEASGASPLITLIYWYSPEVRRAVKMTVRQVSASRDLAREQSFELSGYQQSR